MLPAPDPILDATPFYRAWSELVEFSLKLALATAHDTPQERHDAWERFLRGQQRALAERDAMWERIITHLEAGQRGK